MSGSISDLVQAQRSGNLLDAIAHPAQVNVLGDYNAAADTAGKMWAIRRLQAEQAAGEASQGAIDKATGEYSPTQYGKNLVAAGPTAALAARVGLESNQSLSDAILGQHLKKLQFVNAQAGALALQPTISDDDIRRSLTQGVAAGVLTPDEVDRQLRTVPADQAGRKQWAVQHRDSTLSPLTQMEQQYGTNFRENIGGQIVGGTQGPSRAGGSLGQGGGAITTTAGPEQQGGNVSWPASEDDVKNGLATSPGQMIQISQADRLHRLGLDHLIPQLVRPGGGAAAPGGPVNRDGSAVGPASPPRLLPVPGAAPATGTAPAPAAAPGTVPPPPGAGPTAPATSLGASIAALPPPAPSAPAPTPAPAPAPVVVAPPAAPPPPTPPRGVPEASLGSRLLNALNPIGTAEAAPPSALAPPSATPPPAPPFRTFTTGQGTQETQNIKTSADRLAADDTAAANFNNNRFPFEQALKEYGRGITTGPGTDFRNRMVGYARSWLPAGSALDQTKEYDALGKWINQIAGQAPGAGRSVEALETTLAGNASTHINEMAGEDMMKAGLALQRMTVAGNSAWHAMSPQEQAQYGGSYLNFQRDYASRVDSRAFGMDLYNPAQRTTLRESISKMTEPEAAKFEYSLNLGRNAGLIGSAGRPALQPMP